MPVPTMATHVDAPAVHHDCTTLTSLPPALPPTEYRVCKTHAQVSSIALDGSGVLQRFCQQVGKQLTGRLCRVLAWATDLTAVGDAVMIWRGANQPGARCMHLVTAASAPS